MTAAIAFAHTEEQVLFRDSLRRFLQEASPTSRVRQVMAEPEGIDEVLWSRMTRELALQGIAVAEKHGGSGFGWVELCLAAEETGRALAPSPFFSSSVMAVAVLATIAPDDPLLARLAAAEIRAATAILEGPAGWMTDGFACSATGDRIEGVKQFVIDGATADVLLVFAREARGTGLYVVEAPAGMTRQPLTVIDPTRRLARLDFSGTPARRAGAVSAVQLDRVLDLCSIALANEMVGGITRLFEDTLAYTRLRVQFGRPIASFQAIKHRMAELLLQVELARSAAYYAAQAVDAGAPDLSYLASLAKSTASDAYIFTAQEAIQLHGGIGFTWDHDTQLWFKRAKSSEVLFGTSAWHRDRMIGCLEHQRAAGGRQA
jgi:alkylation response protein AidB-like acyl-CoA dehydrogenase